MIVPEIIEYYESELDLDEPTYLMTWSPDPAELPDCDFKTQHRFNVNILADYLRNTKTGLFCVESTQLGNPHYHGFYQIDGEKELQRICLIKVLKRFGLLKITKARTVKVNDYRERKNALYYYKKELFDSMEGMEYNPIHKDTFDPTDWSQAELRTFFTQDMPAKAAKLLADRISDRKYYRQFYTDST